MLYFHFKGRLVISIFLKKQQVSLWICLFSTDKIWYCDDSFVSYSKNKLYIITGFSVLKGNLKVMKICSSCIIRVWFKWKFEAAAEKWWQSSFFLIKMKFSRAVLSKDFRIFFKSQNKSPVWEFWLIGKIILGLFSVVDQVFWWN